MGNYASMEDSDPLTWKGYSRVNGHMCTVQLQDFQPCSVIAEIRGGRFRLVLWSQKDLH